MLEGLVHSFNSVKLVSRNWWKMLKRGNFFLVVLFWFLLVLHSFVFIICTTISNYCLLCLLSYTKMKKVIVCWKYMFESLLYYTVYLRVRGRNPTSLSHTNVYTCTTKRNFTEVYLFWEKKRAKGCFLKGWGFFWRVGWEYKIFLGETMWNIFVHSLRKIVTISSNIMKLCMVIVSRN